MKNETNLLPRRSGRPAPRRRAKGAPRKDEMPRAETVAAIGAVMLSAWSARRRAA